MGGEAKQMSQRIFSRLFYWAISIYFQRLLAQQSLTLLNHIHI